MDNADSRQLATPARRHFLHAGAAAALGLLVPLAGRAQARPGSIRDLRGDVQVNGRQAGRDAVIRAGDRLVTAPDGFVVFVVGQDAFMLRGRSELQMQAAREFVVDSLRLVTGALGAVFGKRPAGIVRIIAPTVTAGIRGTGVYCETGGEGTYFCTCYGTVELRPTARPADFQQITATRHNAPQMVLAQARDAQYFAPASFATHTDAEMEMLERSVGRRAPWIGR